MATTHREGGWETRLMVADTTRVTTTRAGTTRWDTDWGETVAHALGRHRCGFWSQHILRPWALEGWTWKR